MIRLRRHRGTLTSTLSSNGSSFTAQKFIKLFAISLSFLLIYLPVTLAFFYFNLPLPIHAYSWHTVHNPDIWSTILLFPDTEFPRLPYYSWPVIVMGFFSFLAFGMSNEAMEMYRKGALNCGLGKIWPGFRQPRVLNRRANTSRSSWTSHLDVVSKALHYFDGNRKQSQSTSMGAPDLDE
jgi:hypothetical protein